ncbi:uncharacterized protein LOC143208164 [Lasioglossum baleicum]|uniref:uncharacterized protein LOC143208164 n=1 Tax=Lasioglossum baleicum TaxID=434251 RepID=UPI003FCC7145
MNLPTTGTKAELISRLIEAGAESYLNTGAELEEEEVIEQTSATTTENVVSRQAAMTTTETELLRRERDLAEEEVLLLRRELEILRVTPRETSRSPMPSMSTKWRDIKDMVANYDGISYDYHVWEKQIKQLIQNYALPDGTAKALVCNKLAAKVLKWYHTRSDCVEMSCENLLVEIKKMFGRRATPLSLRKDFEARKWAPGEVFADYVHDKITMANRVPVADNELIDYVIDGIPNESYRTQARIQCFQSIDALLTAFEKVILPRETTRREGVHREENWTMVKKISKTPREQKDGATTRCYNCNETGHFAASCPKLKDGATTRCYNCNETGHFAASCLKSKRERGSCYKCGKFGHRSNQCQPEMKEVYCAEEEDDFRRLVEVCMGSFKLNCKALLDSGSSISFIKKQFIPREYIMFDVGTERYYGLNRSSIKLIGCVEVTLVYDIMKYRIMLRVVQDETMNSDLILGRDFMKITNLSLCKKQESIDSTDISNIELDEISTLTEEICVNEDLPFELRMTVQKLFQKFYVEPKRPLNPATENILTLTLTDKKPFSCAPRRLSYSEKVEVRKIIDGLIAKGIIRESTSEYASPIVLVKKKTGETRMCVDFRKLNKVTLRDNFPLPLIEDQLDLLEGKKYFTSLDLKDGFFHIRMDEESIKYTSFVTPLGQYEYVRMPFGLKGAPLKFQRYVTQIFKKHIDSGEISIYMDDFLIATETIEQHLQILEKVFKLLVANRLELRLDKCQFMQTKLIYLGYTVTNVGIHPTDNGLEAVKNFPIPRNVRDVQSFLGMCSYFRKFVKNFSIIAKPLYDLTRKNVDFKFNETEERAFHELKGRLIEAPILSIYSPRDDTELHCDASAAGFGKQEGSLHSIPKDRGSCFTSREFEEFMKTCNVQHIKISTASPQANEDVEFACNNSNSKATNECPSVLLYGVRQRGKVIDHLKDALELERKITVNRDLEKCRKRAENQIIKNQEVNKRIYDTRHKAARKYKVGDKVMDIVLVIRIPRIVRDIALSIPLR